MDNHNNFCIYCGAKLVPNQHFCSKCGKEIYSEELDLTPVFSEEDSSKTRYSDEISKIENEYNLKQSRALELVNKLFTPSDMAYDKFSSAINKSNQIFNNQLSVVKKMDELDFEGNELVEKEIESKMKTLEKFIDKIDSLINELIIHLSSNKKDDEDVNNLFEDMDDLIDSVKNY